METPKPTRDRIVDAADQLIAERGFAATSIAEVAERAGVLKGNLAYYFPSKLALLAAVGERRRSRLWTQLASAGGKTPTGRDFVEALLAHVEATAEELARFGCPIGGLSVEASRLPVGNESIPPPLLCELEAQLQEEFAHELPPAHARACAEQLLALLQGAAVLARARGDAGPVLRQVRAARHWLDQVMPGATGAPAGSHGIRT
jgi:TetR/AcrR family transcriptional repressor of nem operon